MLPGGYRPRMATSGRSGGVTGSLSRGEGWGEGLRTMAACFGLDIAAASSYGTGPRVEAWD